MEILKLVVCPGYMTNCYVLACEKTKEAIIVDPGDEAFLILRLVDENQFQLKFIIATHAHFDHICAAGEIQDERKIPFLLHEREMPALKSAPSMSGALGVEADDLPTVDEYIDPDANYRFGECEFKILETPGHSPGGVCFLFPEHVFVGDTLFSGAIGKTDIAGASRRQLMNSIRTRLFALDEKIIVHPGHGDETTIGREKRANPVFKDETC